MRAKLKIKFKFQLKHVLRVVKRTVSGEPSLEIPKHMLTLMEKNTLNF